MLKVIVKRSRWQRGTGPDDSALRDVDSGKMCCLGFVLLAAGHTIDEINGIGTPCGLNKEIKCPGLVVQQPAETTTIPPHDPKYWYNTRVCSDMVLTNDDIDLKDDMRESKLKRFGKKVDIDFHFVD